MGHTQSPSESQTPSVAVWQSTASAPGHKRERQMALSTDCLGCKMAKSISPLNETITLRSDAVSPSHEWKNVRLWIVLSARPKDLF